MAGRCWRPLPRVLARLLGRLLPHLLQAEGPVPLQGHVRGGLQQLLQEAGRAAVAGPSGLGP